MGSKKNVDMTATSDVVKHVSSETPTEETVATKPKKNTGTLRHKGKKYISVRSQVDKTKTYDAFAAIELLKRLSYSRFDGTVSADIVVKEGTSQIEITLPHSTGKTVRVAIATDELLTQIEAGTIEFDVLVASRQFVPKLAKFARILGPRGLMPNPKNGTITDNPEAKKKELEAGKMTIKTEKKQPVMHVTIGKIGMETQALVENLNALFKALDTRAVRATISATMSPGIKVKL